MDDNQAEKARGKPKKYILKAGTGHYALEGNPVELLKKYREDAWIYLSIGYAILLTLSVGIIQIFPWAWQDRIFFMINGALLLFSEVFFDKKIQRFMINVFEASNKYFEKGF